MASRKRLKKDINYVVGDIFTECLININYVPGTDADAVAQLMADLLNLNNDFIARVSHTEPGKAGQYYSALRKDFDQRIGIILDKLEKAKK